jgi:hypothetical protein
VTGISGWVSGYLQLPSLSAQIPAGNVEFCQDGGPAGPLSCFDATPTPGECLSIGLGAAGAIGGGLQPTLPTTNIPLEPVTLNGPSTLGPGVSGVYTFTTLDREFHAGIATFFCAGSASPCDGPTTPPRAAGTVYYNGYPWDAYSGQQINISNVTINGLPAGKAPGPVLAPGSTYTVSATATDPGPWKMTVSFEGGFGQPINHTLLLRPGQSLPFSFTGTVQAGAQDVMIAAGGLAYAAKAGGPITGSFANGFGTAYYRGGSVPAGLKVSNEMVQGLNGKWAPASTAPGPNVSQTNYNGRVTLTNTSNSTISNIKGTTAAESCFEFALCTRYLVTLTPDDRTVDPASTCQFAAELKVTGVASDGSIQVQGSACSKTEVDWYTTPTFILATTQTQPTVVTVSSTPGPLPATAPPPPTPGNPDERNLQFPLHGLHGPLQSATGSIGTNDFAIPAFQGAQASVINSSIGGWNAAGTPNYTSGPIAGQPGWNQFVADTSVVQVGLPVGVPSGFTWSTP